jgi:hypothetical protein
MTLDEKTKVSAVTLLNMANVQLGHAMNCDAQSWDSAEIAAAYKARDALLELSQSLSKKVNLTIEE